MNLDLKLITIAQEICKDIKAAGAQEVMVAGGYVSNMLLNKPINDIDVFYTGTIVNPYKKKEIPKPAIKNTWWGQTAAGLPAQMTTIDDLLNIEENSIEGYGDAGWNVTNYEVYKDGVDFPIQLIKVTNFYEHLDTFGAGIRKVAITESGLYMTHEFMKNVVLETISFSVPQHTKFYQKIVKQFPEYSYA